VGTQGRQSSFTIAKTQSTPSSATTSDRQEEGKNSRMLRSRYKPSSAGARKVSPARVDEDANAQRRREEADTGQEQEGTTASVKRRRIDSPDGSSIRGSAMPMRERIPYSMVSERSHPDERLFHESHRFLPEGPSRYMGDPSHYSEIVQNIWKKMA
jgi:hypothetical protein